jgi:hypothetical protein
VDSLRKCSELIERGLAEHPLRKTGDLDKEARLLKITEEDHGIF